MKSLETFIYVVWKIRNETFTTFSGVKLQESNATHVIKHTTSLCPQCLDRIDATLIEKDGQALIVKDCPTHGHFEDVYWSDYELFNRFDKYSRVGKGLTNPRTQALKGCPYDCGVCPNHKSHTVLSIIDVTNACNLQCSICFAYAGKTGYLYTPTLEQIGKVMDNLRANSPVAPPAIQLSGGEPTIRPDLIEIVRMAKEKGFKHIEVNTNGIKIADGKSGVELIRQLKEAGADTFYLSFDGVTPEPYVGRAPSHLDEESKQEYAKWLFGVKMQAIQNSREAGMNSLVLVPTIVRGMNDHQLGDIINFAIKNVDVVRCVNFQPVSFAGRTEQWEVEKGRITIPEALHKIEEETNGLITTEDFYPVPCVFPISDFLNEYRKKQHVEFTVHPHCGAATYLYVDKGKATPITKLANVDAFFNTLSKAAEDTRHKHRTRATLRVGASALRNINLRVLSKIMPAILKGDFDSLRQFHYRSLMIGMMHFMDPYNFDLERVERCCIHYGFPDGKIVPFCTMNSLHRKTLEKAYAVPIPKQTKKNEKTKA